MQTMVDHAAAVIIGIALLLLLAAMSLRAQDSSVEAAQVEIGKGELRSLVDLLEQDLNNMGSGMTFPNTNNGNRVIRTFGPGSGADAGYTVFSFYGLGAPGGAADTVLVTYRSRQQGTATLPSGATVNTFVVERTDPAGRTARYTSATRFALTLTTKEYSTLAPGSLNLEEARYVTADVAMVSPLGAEGVLEQTRWAKQFRPLNLTPEGRQVVQAACFPVGAC
jgi:hypothetical protein